MRQRLSWIAVGMVVLGIGYYGMFLFSGAAVNDGNYNSYNMPDEKDTLFGDIFKTPYFNDSLPHYMYKKYTDSLQNASLKDGYVTSASALFGSFGYAKESILPTVLADENLETDSKYKVIEDTLNNIYADTNYLKDSTPFIQRIQSLKKIQKRILLEQYDTESASKDRPSKYYFVINDFKFKDYNSRFFVKNGNNYVAYPVIDKKEKSNRGGIITESHFEREEVNYKFVASGNALMFPISKSFYDVLMVGFWIISFLLVIVVIYVFLGLPIGILINISKGHAFIDQNIQFLKILLKWAIAFTVLKTLIPFFLYLIFYKAIASHFVFADWGSFLSEIFWSYVLCFVLFLIMKAFEKGYEMQKNEDLTV